MADEQYTYDEGKVCWVCEEEQLYLIPDQIQDKYFEYQKHGKLAKWIDDNDDPDDLGGHFEAMTAEEAANTQAPEAGSSDAQATDLNVG